MRYLPVSQLPVVGEDEATGEVAEVFSDIKRQMQLPGIPNSFKVLASSPAALTVYWRMFETLIQRTTLPEALISMMLYTIAQRGDCQYCSAAQEFNCRQLGVDQATLDALAKDLSHVSPQRIQAIIEFAERVAHDPKGLKAEDYERIREQGVSDEEIVEIILIASIGLLNDTVSDAFKVEVDEMIARNLGR